MSELTADETLLRDVKDYLHISWSDEVTERLVNGYVARGKVAIAKYAGALTDEIDFNTEGTEKQLLLDYCRYARSEALEAFEKNYNSELTALRLEYQVKAMDEEVTEDEDSDAT